MAFASAHTGGVTLIIPMLLCITGKVKAEADKRRKG